MWKFNSSTKSFLSQSPLSYPSSAWVFCKFQTVIDANKANVKLDFKEAAALDLAGDQMLEVAKNIAKKQVLERHHLNQK